MQSLQLDGSPEQIREAIVSRLQNKGKTGEGSAALADILTEICQQLKQLRDDLSSIQNDRMIMLAVRQLLEKSESIGPNELPALSLPKSAHLLASEAWDPTDGFYQLEWTDSGRPFRWVGPRRHFRFVVVIDRSNPVKCVLKAPFAHPAVNVRDLKCRIDGYPVPLLIVKTEFDYIISAIAPAEETSRSVLIDFAGPTTVPASSDGDDPRHISLAISELSLEPISPAELAEFDAEVYSATEPVSPGDPA
ncbi:MAG TPA: hypothetical protein VK446_07000 [Methylocystis sp.]|nr:hypothetical protein [Methylocystis sp.]